jgi:ComF family protein
MLDPLRSALLDALALFFPVECAGCGAPDRAVCAACRDDLRPIPAYRALADGTPVVTALRYEGVARRVILALKEEGRTEVVRALAPAVIAALGAVPDAALLVPVPSSRPARRGRGFDPVLVLLRAAGFRATPVLRLRSARKQQALGAEERAANRTGSMRARRELAGIRVVVIDDVMTTGATLAEAVRAIRDAGGDVVGCVAVAFTPKLFGRASPRSA